MLVSRMMLVERVDLVIETPDARMGDTLPFASNLTFLTALVGGLPAAAGVYLVSKLLERQVDQATSVSYRISGDWDDQKIKFDRLFEGNMRLNSNGQDDRGRTSRRLQNYLRGLYGVRIGLKMLTYSTKLLLF